MGNLDVDKAMQTLVEHGFIDKDGHPINIRSNAISRHKEIVRELPPVTPMQRTGRCVWCSSPFRIEYYWIDRDGNTASFEDENKHIVATGIAKFCPNCGRRLIEGSDKE